MDQISSFFKEYWNMVLSYSSEEKLLTLNWDDFIRLVSVMNIKSCGTNIEKRILAQNNWIKVRGHDSHGDGMTPDGRIIEIKSSIVSPLKGSSVTFRGIRPWHKIDEHHFILTDLSDFRNKPITTTFMLTPQQIIYERDVEKVLTRYNKKKADVIDNENIELGTSFKKDDLKRWENEYRSKINL